LDRTHRWRKGIQIPYLIDRTISEQLMEDMLSNGGASFPFAKTNHINTEREFSNVKNTNLEAFPVLSEESNEM